MTILLSELAATKIKEIAEDEELKLVIRVKIVGGGCSGFSHDLYFEEAEPSDMDEVFESWGVKIVIDPLSYQYLDGTLINYEKKEFQEGFKFENPNVKSTCGCGSSVGF